jgi:hypothetical protein
MDKHGRRRYAPIETVNFSGYGGVIDGGTGQTSGILCNDCLQETKIGEKE